MNPAPNRSLRQAENSGDLHQFQLSQRGQSQRLAQLLRQRVDAGVQPGLQLPVYRPLLGSVFAGRHLLGEILLHHPGPSPPDGQPPGDPRQVSPLVLDRFPSLPSINLEKGLLRHVLGVVRIARHRKGDAIDKMRMPFDEGGKRTCQLRAFSG